MAKGSKDNLTMGAGVVRVAAIGTSEPTTCSAELPSADWRQLGYTEEGWTITIERESEDIMVAEEIEPVDSMVTALRVTINAGLVETTAANVRMALGLGPNVAYSSVSPFDGPDAETAETAFQLVWDSMETPTAANKRWLFRNCKIASLGELAKAKAPAKTQLPVSIKALKGTSTSAFKVFPNSSGLL